MRKNLFFVVLFMGLSMAINAQSSITVHFSGKNTDGEYVQLDSVSVTNITQQWAEKIYYPDTIMKITYVSTGISETAALAFGISDITPNPFDGETTLKLTMPESGNVSIKISDINGRVVAFLQDQLNRGIYTYKVKLQHSATYIISASSKYGVVTSKLINSGNGGQNIISQVGVVGAVEQNMSLKATMNHIFQRGDVFKYIGYITVEGRPYTSIVVLEPQNAIEYLTMTFIIKNKPTVTTDVVSKVTSATAICGGNVIDDGNATVNLRGVCWRTSPTPTIADNKTIDGSGMGSFVSAMSGLISNTTYYVRAYATNSEGTSYGEELSFTPCDCGAFTDSRDNNTYTVVKLGQQCWMAENLRYLPSVDSVKNGSEDAGHEVEAYYYVYGYDGEDVSAAKAYTLPKAVDSVPAGTNIYRTFGVLYNWNAAMNGGPGIDSLHPMIQGVCPNGWHFPSNTEWNILQNYLIAQGYNYDGSTMNNKIAKSMASPQYWSSYSTVGTTGNDVGSNNRSGFSALPAGYRGFNGGYYSLGIYASWSAPLYGNSSSYYRSLYYARSYLDAYSDRKSTGNSVRCVKN